MPEKKTATLMTEKYGTSRMLEPLGKKLLGRHACSADTLFYLFFTLRMLGDLCKLKRKNKDATRGKQRSVP